MFKWNLSEVYGVSIRFRYVRSEDSLSELLTRGLTYSDFYKKWLSGPSCLPSLHDAWPDSILSCLSEKDQVEISTASEF